MTNNNVLSSLSQFDASKSPASLKFGIFLKTHEIQQIEQALQPVLLMTKKQRQAWVKENQSLIDQLLDTFVEDAQAALDGLDLDAEGLKLSVEFVTSLRNVMNVLQTILYDQGSITS
jgi:hypothetical protein